MTVISKEEMLKISEEVDMAIDRMYNPQKYSDIRDSLRKQYKGIKFIPIDDFCEIVRTTKDIIYEFNYNSVVTRKGIEYVNLSFIGSGGRKKKDIRTATGKNYIYLLRAEGLNRYKIGIASNIKDRIKRIQTASPVKINSIHHVYTENVVLKEKDLHEYYKSQRVIGEWFELNTAEVAQLISKMEKLK